jgi:hypothetical protein
MTTAAIPFEYQGHPVRFNVDGWINATEAASRFGKQPHEWLRLPETVAYLAAFDRAMGSTSGEIPYVKTSRARKDRGGGTWLHPKLAVPFARWLSPDFAVWCDLHIDALLRGDAAVRLELERACKALGEGQGKASESGRQLANWRYHKPGLVSGVHYWREQLQLCLGLDTAE